MRDWWTPGYLAGLSCRALPSESNSIQSIEVMKEACAELRSRLVGMDPRPLVAAAP